MINREKVKYDIERCICHVPDACRDCSHYGHGEVIGCMEELLTDTLALLKEQEPIEPKFVANEGAYYCGKCHFPLGVSGVNYCSGCGKPVKWDE